MATIPRARRAVALLVASVLAAAVGVTAMAAPASADTAPPAAIAGFYPTPSSDPFYAPPAGFAATAPGTVLRSRQVYASLLGLPAFPAKVYQLLFRTTDSNGNPIATATTIFVPLTPAIGPRKALSFQIAIDSLGSICNPSSEFRLGVEKELTSVYPALSVGWTAIVTDYEGPEMAWSAGRVAGQATLDGIRAAENFAPSQLNHSSQVAGWGYSGGGQASAWAAQLQPSYAPELNIAGWVAGDFVADVRGLLAGSTVDGTAFSGLELGAVAGIARDYPYLYSLLNAAGVAKLQSIKDQCQVVMAVANAFTSLKSYVTTDPLTDPGALAVMADDSVGAQAPTAPTLLQSGALDEIIPPSQGDFANAKWCAKGGNVQFQRTYTPEHILNDITAIPGTLAWISARFAGLPFTPTC